MRLLPFTALLLIPLPACAADKPATCTVQSESILSRSSSGIPQVSNLADIEIECSVPARPYPSRPGESRSGLRATATSFKISPEGSKEPSASRVNVRGGGSDEQNESVDFSINLPLSPHDRGIEAARWLDWMEHQAAQLGSLPPDFFTAEHHRRMIKGLSEDIPQNQLGHFLIECQVTSDDQPLGIGIVEFEVLYKGRASDPKLDPGPNPSSAPSPPPAPPA